MMREIQGMIYMNEQTMIWFLQKTARYELSREATSVWLDFYSYLQNQNRACNPQIPFAILQELCDVENDVLQQACQELKEAGMLRFIFENGTIFCRLTAGKLYRSPEVRAV